MFLMYLIDFLHFQLIFCVFVINTLIITSFLQIYHFLFWIYPLLN